MIAAGDVVQLRWNLDHRPGGDEYLARYSTGRVIANGGHLCKVDFYGHVVWVPTASLLVIEESIHLSERCIQAMRTNASAGQRPVEILWLKAGEDVPRGYEYQFTDNEGYRHYWREQDAETGSGH